MVLGKVSGSDGLAILRTVVLGLFKNIGSLSHYTHVGCAHDLRGQYLVVI